MSGAISGINYSLLFSSQTSSETDTSILNTLYSGASSSSSPPTNFVSSGNPIADLTLAQQEQATGVKQEALQPQVANAINAFKTAVSHATSIQSALSNPDVQKVLLTANGLSNYVGETALAQQLLLSNPDDPNSLVNQFGDSTWLQTAQTYNFSKNGLSELQNPTVISALTSGYSEVMWRESLDQATPGLSNALSFLSQASSIKSPNDILDNMVNFEVVTTALGIPQGIVNQSNAAQVSAITSRLDISKLQDHQYVTSLTDQYLLVMQENNTSSSSSSTSLESLAMQASGLLA